MVETTVFPPNETAEDEAIDALGQRLTAQFAEVVAERKPYEDQWLKDLRQYQGKHDPEDLAKMSRNKSQAFVNKTRVKVKTMDARVMDMMFPSGSDKNWAIKPIDIAKPTPELKHQMRLKLIEEMAKIGKEMVPDDSQIEEALADAVKSSAKKMTQTIADQLTEGKWQEKGQDVVHSGHLSGIGYMKGPMMEERSHQRWELVEDKETKKFDYQVKKGTSLKPYFEYVPIWNVYPDISEMEPEYWSYIFQRHVMPKHEVRRLAKRKDFNGDVMRKYLVEHPQGDAGWLYHETEIKNINEKMDAVKDRKNKYQLLEYWGYVDGSDLAEHGHNISDEEMNKEFWANIWILGDKVVKAVLNPSDVKSNLYHVYRFEKDDTSPMGVSIPSIIEGPQKLLNASYRAALDNAAISAGPQFEINVDLLDKSENPTEVYPFRIWMRKGRGNEARAAAVKVFNIDSHVPELLRLAQEFERILDEVSSIPSYQHGEADKGVGRTVGGLSMLMGAANITVKDVVRNFDALTKSFILSMYHWNMQFNEDREIRGDYEIKVTGSSSLVAKELLAQSLINFASIVNADPEGSLIVKKDDMYRGIANATDLPEDLVRSETEIEKLKIRAQQAQAAAEAEANQGAAA